MGYSEKSESLTRITPGAAAREWRPADSPAPCTTIHDGLAESKHGDQEIDPFPDPERLKFYQSPNTAEFKRSKARPLVYLPGISPNFLYASTAY